MYNTLISNEDAIKLYRTDIKDWFEHLKANLNKVVGDLTKSGFRCALCSEEIDAEAFKRDDYSALTR